MMSSPLFGRFKRRNYRAFSWRFLRRWTSSSSSSGHATVPKTATTTRKVKRESSTSITTATTTILAAASIDDDDDDDQEDEGLQNTNVLFLLYTGQPRTEISRSVTHVRVHPSVKKILPRAFEDCTQLREVKFGCCRDDDDDGAGTMVLQLETIGGRAFRNCFTLEYIQLPMSVQSISRGAYENCTHLKGVELNEGLVAIKTRAFGNCASLERILLPSTVQSISHSAFRECTRLWEVELNEGLEMIGNGAFGNCIALEYIKIPSTVKSISRSGAIANCKQQVRDVDWNNKSDNHDLIVDRLELEDEFVSSLNLDYWGRIRTSIQFLGTFHNCVNLRVVEFCEGVEMIGPSAFFRCTSLEQVIIPSTVTSIDSSAFNECANMVSVEFCEEIEEFVSGELIREWWRNGLSHEALVASCFFAKYNIPKRVGMLRNRKFHMAIRDKLRHLPSIVGTSPIAVPSRTVTDLGTKYLLSINSMLTDYETLKETVMLLELSIWKSKLDEYDDIDLRLPNFSSATERAKYRNNCGSTVIIPNVISFLVGE